MNSMRKIGLLLAVLAVSIVMGHAQTLKNADKAFAHEEYYKAIDQYKAASSKLTTSKEKGYAKYRIGESYRRMNDPQNAIEWFTAAEKDGYTNAELLYSKGEMLNMQASYDEARAYFIRYRDAKPNDLRVALKLSAIDFAQAYQKVNPYFKLKPIESINTTGSEFGIAYFNENLVYASTGSKVESLNEARTSMRTGLGYSKIYLSAPLNGTYSRGTEMKEFNVDRSNDGTFSYDPVNKTAYYTRCEPFDNECYIFYATQENGKWKEKGKLKIDSKILQVAHPSVSQDGNRIYFSAMIEGGFGGSDIWFVEKDGKGGWGKAINAGREVNTSGNEVFPFVIDDVLFFSSDGHEGYGGLDIYASKIEYGSHGKVVNLRPPFNSSYDDFNLIVNSNRKEGMLVSNRYNDKSSDDVFSFQGFPTVLTVSGYVFDKELDAPIPNATLSVAADGDFEEEVQADSSGFYYTFLKPEASYTIASEQEGFIPEAKILSTTDVYFPNDFSLQSGYDMDFYLEKEKIIRSITGKVYDKKTRKPLAREVVYLTAANTQTLAKRTNDKGEYKFDNIEAEVEYKLKVENKDYFAMTKTLNPVKQDSKTTVFSKANGYDMDFALEKIELGVEIEIKDIYYDLDKANLRPESKIELNKIVALFHENPGLKIQISSHTDARGSATYNQKLSESRAQSVLNYLTEKGIAKNRLVAKGYGKQLLRIKNAKTEEEHSQNRRTTFKILEIGKTGTVRSDSFVFVDDDAPSVQTKNQTAVSKSPVPSTPKEASDGTFTVQVSIAARLDMTDPKIRKIEKELGLKVWTEKGKDNRYRYFVGKYRDRDQAAEMVKKLKSIGISDSFIKNTGR